MKKKLLSIIVASLVGVLAVTGCASTANTKEENSAEATVEEAPTYADQDFLNDLSSGLIKRWDISDSVDQKINDGSLTAGSSEHKQLLLDCVNAELEKIEQYRSALFEDSKLQELAISYINAVNDQLKAMDDFNTDSFDTLWEAAYDKRAKTLYALISDYELSVDESHQASLDMFKSYGNQVKQAEDNQHKVDELLKGFEFEETNNEYGYKTYSAIVENTSGIDFATFNISVNVLDADGVLVETEYASFENWSSGVKAKFEFSTDKDFAKTEVHSEYICDVNGVEYK